MIDFLAANAGTIVAGLVVLAIILLVIFKMKKDKKQGKSSCGCSCGCCPNAQLCHPNTEKTVNTQKSK